MVNKSITSFQASTSINNNDNVEVVETYRIHNNDSETLSSTCKRRKVVKEEQQRNWCKKCVSKEPRVSCISKWYPDASILDEEIAETCPVCCHKCSSQACLPGCSPKDIKGYSCSEHDKVNYAKHIFQKVFPLVTSLNNEQLMEKEIEAKVKGISISELQLDVIECDVGEDIFCDNCGTYIFDLYRRCACGYELCLSCCRDLRDKVIMTSGWKACIDGSIPCPPKDVGGCDDGILELKHIMPVDWVANMVEEAQGVCTSFDIPQTSFKGCNCNDIGDEACTASSLYTLSSEGIEPEDMQHFQLHWSQGEPIIVGDVLSTSSRLNWEPMVLWRAFHHIKRSRNHTHSHAYDVKAIICSDWSEVTIDLYKFFRGYLEECPLLMKLEDWLPSCVSEEEWPHHFVEFVKCLPFKDYTHPHDGYLNVLNKLPDLSLKPNMGPRMDITYRGSVIKIRCDKSDTVNVLTHTSSTKRNKTKEHEGLVCEEGMQRNKDGQFLDDQVEEGALWDIYRRQDTAILEEYIRKHSEKPIVHPIHDRNFYLDIEHKRKLKEEFGIEPWSIKQKLGDAIFIPAGCAYQVKNLKSNTKVEFNFLSPESLEECILLQQKFRMLPTDHRAKQEVLNIGKTIIYALDHAMADLAKVIHSNEIQFIKGSEISNVDDADINDHAGRVYESDSVEESGTPMPEEKASETPLEVVGVWKGHAVGLKAKELLQDVECHYPTTFRGVFFCSEEFIVAILQQFSVFIKRFREISMDTLSLDQMTTLKEELDDFEKAGFDLSWAHQQLNMADMSKFEDDSLQKKVKAIEESLEPLKARLVEKMVILTKSAKMLEKAQFDYDKAVNNQNRKALKMENKFGADYDRVLNGQLGLGLLPRYKII
uniref:lysine-specific demethylase JMJ25-like n=1 Tax=Erigeron canadensis TaxID=72917 RepID=UPI001CB93C88|nr:lysine-specific demethylase JMJ25-like [Erigeron canadensis]